MTTVPLGRISGMKTLHLSASLALALMVAACGGSNAASDPAAAAASSSASTNAASLKAVPHEKLTELLPKMSGWTQEREPSGDTDTATNVSRVTVNYQQGGGMGGISVEMMDVASNQQMIAPLTAMLKATGTKTNAAGTQKVITVGGHIATEEWAPAEKNGSVSILVADRFVVTVTGSTVENVGVIHKVVDSIDLKKLAALK